jgi:hypothetical protein
VLVQEHDNIQGLISCNCFCFLVGTAMAIFDEVLSARIVSSGRKEDVDIEYAMKVIDCIKANQKDNRSQDYSSSRIEWVSRPYFVFGKMCLALQIVEGEDGDEDGYEVSGEDGNGGGDNMDASDKGLMRALDYGSSDDVDQGFSGMNEAV